MPLRLEEIRHATREEWEHAFATVDHATFFQGHGWADVWSAHTRGRVHPAALMVRFSDGASACLPLSVERQRWGRGRRALLSPAGTYGGALCSQAMSAGHMDLLFALLRARFGGITWRMSPFDPAVDWMERQTGVAADVTHVVKLGDPEEQRREWTKGHRSAARKAEREGVTIRQAADDGDWDAYFRLYRMKLTIWGKRATSMYPLGFFRLLARTPGVVLWLATYAGEPVAGALCLYGRRHVAYWHGASDPSRAKLQPAHLLIGSAMRAAARDGYWWFDFHPSGGNAGVETFKRGFGAVALPCPVLRLQPTSSSLRAFVARAMRRGAAAPPEMTES